MKKNIRYDENALQRHKLTWALCGFYFAWGVLLTFINTFIAPDFFFNVAAGVIIIVLISAAGAAVPVFFLKKINASFLIICSSAVLTAAFTAVTLAGGEFFQLFLLVFCCVIAVVTAFYGWQDLQGRERKSKLSVIIVIAVVIVLLMGLFVLYICPVKDGVSYGIKGDSYTVMRVKNSEKIIIADTVNGLKVTSVQRGVFYGKDKCEELYIPSSVNYIHEGALFSMRSLKKLTFNPSVVNSVLDRAVFGELWYTGEEWGSGQNFDPSLNGSVVPESLKELVISGNVPDYYFYGCNAITNVSFEKAAKRIGSYAFAFCEGLVSVDDMGNVSELAQGAFGSCTALTSVAKSRVLRTVGVGAFESCESLRSFYFPGTVESVGAYVFSDAYFYLHVDIVATQKEVENNSRWDPAWLYKMNTFSGYVELQVRSITYDCEGTLVEV